MVDDVMSWCWSGQLMCPTSKLICPCVWVLHVGTELISKSTLGLTTHTLQPPNTHTHAHTNIHQHQSRLPSQLCVTGVQCVCVLHNLMSNFLLTY